jgi:hypothetical protein
MTDTTTVTATGTTTATATKPARDSAPGAALPGPDLTAPDQPGVGPGRFAPRVRGRHRRPRPRKVLLAAGGLALAAGVLSLVRMAPESGVGGVGTAEAGPRQDPGGGTDRSTNAAAVGILPRVSPSATSAMGGISATPTPEASLVPAPSTTASPAPAGTATTIPDATDAADRADTAAAPAPRTVPPSPAPTTAAPQQPQTQTPTPSGTTAPPAPKPDQPGVCVPVIGLCVDSPAHHG